MLDSLIIAFSMYSAIPMPRTEWKEKPMRYALCWFPLIGAVEGAALYAAYRFLHELGAGEIVLAAAGTALPLLLTGGIHLDGFLDTSDALHSFGDTQKKLEILKDPHIGAFAVIRGGIYLVLYLAAMGAVMTGRENTVLMMGGLFVLERAMSGSSVVTFPKAKKDGLAQTFSSSAADRAVKAASAFWGIAGAFWISWIGGLAGVIVVLLDWILYALYYRTATRQFGGMTGDLAGWFLQRCELCGALVIGLVSLMVEHLA